MGNYIYRYISLDEFIFLGGTPVNGMKVYTNPDQTSLKEFTFIEIIPGKGVKIENEENLFGTGWLYVREKLQLMPRQTQKNILIDELARKILTHPSISRHPKK